jgi:hypothetical protein
VGGSGNRGGIKGGAIFWAETRQGAGKNLKRQHSQANKKYHEIGTCGAHSGSNASPSFSVLVTVGLWS